MATYRDLDEPTLFQRYKEGDAYARKELIGRYTPMVHEIINRRNYGSRRISPTTLASEGLLHVKNAVDTYDPTRGTQLKTHVWNNIDHGLGRFVDDHTNVARISAGRVKYIGRFQAAEEELFDELGRQATADELAAHLRATVRTAKPWDAKEVERMRKELRKDLLATDLLSEEGGDSLGDVSNIVNTQYSDTTRMADVLTSLTESYSPKDSIMLRRMYEGYTDDDIMETMPGVTLKDVSELRRKARSDMKRLGFK